MVNYQLGKIYKLTSENTDKVYIGSTSRPELKTRFQGHKSCYKRWLKNLTSYISSFELFKCGDVKIVLIEEYPCNSVEELHKREGEITKEYGEKCINKNISGRNRKQYGKDNKELLNKLSREYYQKNKKMLKEKNTVDYECGCGSVIQKREKARHFRSLTHLFWLENN